MVRSQQSLMEGGFRLTLPGTCACTCVFPAHRDRNLKQTREGQAAGVACSPSLPVTYLGEPGLPIVTALGSVRLQSLISKRKTQKWSTQPESMAATW